MIAALLAAAAVLLAGLGPTARIRARAHALADTIDSTIDGRAPAAPRRRRLALARPRRAVSVPEPLELAGWCDALARAVRGGTTLRLAIVEVRPPASITATIEAVRLQLERGAALRAALESVDPVPVHLDLVLVVLRACAAHGGPPAEPIDRVASALRQRAALIGERRSQSAQAQLSAVVMTLLPGALLAVLLVTSPPVRSAVVGPIGATVVAAGATVNAFGWWWMRRLIRGRGPWA